ncbi:MAG: hypothetical protein RIC52_12085 [Amphiplicatus sp.]
MKQTTLWRSRTALAALLAALSGATGAPAQQPGDAAQDDRARVITPSRAPARLARPQTEKNLAPIDWAAVRETIRETRERDQLFERQQQSSTVARAPSPRPEGLRALTPRQLGRVDAREVAQTRVPLLAPVTADTVPTLRVAARENAFTALADLPGGASIELLGTRLRVVGGGADVVKMRQAQRRRFQARLAGLDAPYVISRHEEGVDLSFSKFGASYLVTIYCPKPDTDERCTKDDFVLSIVQNLAILNESEGDGQ